MTTRPIVSKHPTVTLYCVVEKGCKKHCKIGVSVSTEKRLASLQAGNKRKLSYSWLMPDITRADCFSTEQYILTYFEANIYGGINPRKTLQSEWIDASPKEVKTIAVSYLEAIK